VGKKKTLPTLHLKLINKVGGQEKDFFEVLVFLKKKLKPRNHPTFKAYK
jgi:hypothetical protein